MPRKNRWAVEGFTSIFDGRAAAASQCHAVGLDAAQSSADCVLATTRPDGAPEQPYTPTHSWYAASRLPAVATLRLDWSATSATAASAVHLGFSDPAGNPSWASNTGGHLTPKPHPAQLTSDLASGQALLRDDVALYSPLHRFRLTLQSVDGNLVLYTGAAQDGAAALWATGGSEAAWAYNQPDGNFVLYRSDGVVLWSSGTYGEGPSTLRVQDDGNLVLYRDSDQHVTWSSNTCCH